jgi:hypothetical protein
MRQLDSCPLKISEIKKIIPTSGQKKSPGITGTQFTHTLKLNLKLFINNLCNDGSGGNDIRILLQHNILKLPIQTRL